MQKLMRLKVFFLFNICAIFAAPTFPEGKQITHEGELGVFMSYPAWWRFMANIIQPSPAGTESTTLPDYTNTPYWYATAAEGANGMYGIWKYIVNEDLRQKYKLVINQDFTKNERNQYLIPFLKQHMQQLNVFRLASFFFMANKICGQDYEPLRSMPKKSWSFFHTVKWGKVSALTLAQAGLYYWTVQKRQKTQDWYCSIDGASTGDIKYLPKYGFYQDKSNWTYGSEVQAPVAKKAKAKTKK